VDTVVFDKTGTLTAGRPSVTNVVVVQQAALPASAIMTLAAAVEQQTNHPIARAIVKHAGGTGVDA
jgi:cation transport ATPase